MVLAAFLAIPVTALADDGVMTITSDDLMTITSDDFTTTGLSTTTIGALTYVTGDVFTDEELAKLNELAEKYEKDAGASLYVTARDAGAQDAEATALQEIKDRIAAGGGYGDVHRAVLLFINTAEENRSFYILERADDGSAKIKSSKMDAMRSDTGDIRKALQDGKYGDAATAFLNSARSALKPGFFQSIWAKLLAALGIGGAASGLAVGSHKSQSPTKKRHYIKDGNISVLNRNERLQGTKVTRKAAEESKKTDHKVDEKTHGGGNTY